MQTEEDWQCQVCKQANINACMLAHDVHVCPECNSERGTVLVSKRVRRQPQRGKATAASCQDAGHEVPISAECMMRTYKTVKCPDNAAERQCPKGIKCLNWHSPAEQRRDPYKVLYSSQQCPAGTNCKRGSKCLFAHGQAEELYHPSRYKINWCKKGNACCLGSSCAFAHAEAELRDATDPAMEALEREYAPPPPTTGIQWTNVQRGVHVPPGERATNANKNASELHTARTKTQGLGTAWTASSCSGSAWTGESTAINTGASDFLIQKKLVPQRVRDAGIPDIQSLRRVAMSFGLEFKDGQDTWHFLNNSGDAHSGDVEESILKIVREKAKRTSKVLESDLFKFLLAIPAGQKVLSDVRSQHPNIDFSLDADAETLTAWLGQSAAVREKALAAVCEHAQTSLREDAEAEATTARVVSDSLEATAKILREQISDYQNRMSQMEAILKTKEDELRSALETLDKQRSVSQQRRDILQKRIDSLEVNLKKAKSVAEASASVAEANAKQKDVRIQQLTQDVAILRAGSRAGSVAAFEERLQAETVKLNEMTAKARKYKAKLQETQGEMERMRVELQAARSTTSGASTNLSEDNLAKQIADKFLLPLLGVTVDRERKQYCLRLMQAFHPDKNPCKVMATKVTQELQNHRLWHD